MGNPMGRPTFPQDMQKGPMAPQLASAYNVPAEGPVYIFGGLKTYETAVSEIEGDILVPVNAAGSVTTFRAGTELPNNCVGIRFIAVAGGVKASFNGAGLRTILNGDSYQGIQLNTLMVVTDATGTVILQPVGTGD